MITAAILPDRTALTCLPSIATWLFPINSAISIPWCASSEPGGGGENGLAILSFIWVSVYPSKGEQISGVAGFSTVDVGGLYVAVGGMLVGVAGGGLATAVTIVYTVDFPSTD